MEFGDSHIGVDTTHLGFLLSTQLRKYSRDAFAWNRLLDKQTKLIKNANLSRRV